MPSDFQEIFLYPFAKRAAKSLLAGLDAKSLTFLFPDAAVLLKAPELTCYSLEEILTEKCRAVKARDFVDIYLILTTLGRGIRSYEQQALQKTRFMLRYDKYVQNLKALRLKELILGEEEKLLLKPLDNRGFGAFLSENQQFLQQLATELKQR